MKNIEELIAKPNIADVLDEKELADISIAACDGYDIDKESRSEWETRHKEAIKLAKQVAEDKNYPFRNAANVKYPLLATASIQFAARAYPNFVKGPEVVRAMVIGDDPDSVKADRALRVSTHMSYQCLNEMEEWEENTDTLLTILPIIGTCFKKTWFDPVLKRNVSEYRSAYDIVMNYMARSMATVPRITELFTLYPNEIEERKRNKTFIGQNYGSSQTAKLEDQELSPNDPDRPHTFLEQHTYLDLDNDGYKEPYIITIHKDSKKVARIAARFNYEGVKRNDRRKILSVSPTQYYTKFSFMPSLDGSIYDFGFGSLLAPINKSINTTINQLLDSGTLYNSNAGFLGKGIQLGRGRGGGNLDFELGEWKTIGFTGDDLRKNIVPLPVKEPSMVLYNLLGFMVTAGERLSSVTEIMTGDQSNTSEKPTTTLARIEQGLMVFSSIHKRLYKAFRSEFKKLYRLNAEFLEPQAYFNVLDSQYAIAREDYNYKDCNIVPIADQNETTNTQKLIKAQILIGMVGQGMNDMEIKRRFLEAMQIPEPNKILEAPPAQPPPEFLLDMEKAKLERDKLNFEMEKYRDTRQETLAKVSKLLAQSVETIAKAEAVEIGPQLELYKTELDALTRKFEVENGNNQGRVATVEAGQSDQGMVQNAGIPQGPVPVETPVAGGNGQGIV